MIDSSYIKYSVSLATSSTYIGHLSCDKMKSLARMLVAVHECADITNLLKQCYNCRDVKPQTHINWTPWPLTFRPMQRIHIDFCGPFLGKYQALVVEDYFDKYRCVFSRTSEIKTICFHLR